MGPNLMDELELFDQIDDLLDFPLDDECGDATLVDSSDCKDFPTWDDALPDSHPLFSAAHGDLSAELSVPYEDIVQLEWLSTFVEESFSSEGLTLGKENLRGSNTSTNHHFQTMSPVSVLESSSSSSSSSSGGKTMPLSPGHRGPQRARSKRPRPATFNPRPAIHLVSPSSSGDAPAYPMITPGFSSESDSFAESPPLKSKPKKIKITLSDAKHHDLPIQAVRKCLHCEITKTPQWRAGPMGPKTLCNACGVRYKSGRLFPEYRPAASPTFVASVHSNSHKKVLEMRTKIEPNTTTAMDTAAKPEPVSTGSLP